METIPEKLKPSVYEYDDYRQYLNALYCHYKQVTQYFSYRYFSNRAGFKSPNFLKLVIDGQRNLTENSIDKVSKAFRMSQAEGVYFRHLVFFCQAQTMKDKNDFAKRMARTRTVQSTHALNQAQLKYYSNWYYIPLRELIGSPGFKEDPNWLSQQFQGEVKPEVLKRAIADLVSLDLVYRDEKGVLRLSHTNLATSNDVLSSLVSGYHLEMISRGGEAIADFAPKDREVSTTCIACSANTVNALKELIRDFRNDVMAIAEQDQSGDLIYQLNIQLFPMAGVKKRGPQ